MHGWHRHTGEEKCTCSAARPVAAARAWRWLRGPCCSARTASFTGCRGHVDQVHAEERASEEAWRSAAAFRIGWLSVVRRQGWSFSDLDVHEAGLLMRLSQNSSLSSTPSSMLAAAYAAHPVCNAVDGKPSAQSVRDWAAFLEAPEWAQGSGAHPHMGSHRGHGAGRPGPPNWPTTTMCHSKSRFAHHVTSTAVPV